MGVYSDTDWAAWRKTQKSAASAIFQVHCLLQQNLNMVCLEALFYKQILEFMRHPVQVSVDGSGCVL